MSDSISSISASSSASSSSSSSSSALSETTKKKLEALGIDTSNIKTETEGQTKLKQAQAAQAAQQVAGQKMQQPQTGNSEDTIKSEAKSLASKMDVAVSTDDDISAILENISAKIDNLKASAGTDEAKKKEVNDFESQYSSISEEYTTLQSKQAMLSGSLSGLASYNKASLALA